MLHYKQALGTVTGNEFHAAITLFARNGWVGAWCNGIFEFQHYHANSHEVLANLADPVEVQFGGPNGPVILFEPGDVVVLPAGTGHCRKSNPASLVVVGAYPLGQENWDLKRATSDNYDLALKEIPQVQLPSFDPVTGSSGPLLEHWR